MIQRQLPRTLVQTSFRVKSSSTCRTCTCRCGLSFELLPTTPKPQQQRRAYHPPRAPSTKDRAKNRESIPLTPAQAAEWNSRRQQNHRWFDHTLETFCRSGGITCTFEQAKEFLADFSQAMDLARGQSSLDPQVFNALMIKHSFNYFWANTISTTLLKDHIPQNLYVGKKLLYTLSRAGYEESTIAVMAHAILQSKGKPALLNSREIAVSRQHLTKIANSNETTNFRAMVLEGKVALNLRQEEYAIEMFNRAMNAAVQASERELSQLNKEDHRRDLLELTAPWHELMQVHSHRSQVKGLDEWAECEAAMEIGCQQDDPLAHKFKADHVKCWEKVEGQEESVHLGTSDWLYHITKAASSGMPQAAYELGVFYAESGWKYIEDEPPNHVKPTPFDSYPSSRSVKTFWDDVLRFVGITGAKLTPQERIFQNAVFPHTAVDRLKMAMGWLKEAMKLGYAPSFLMMARLFNRKTLWAQADAPQSALQLQDSRYTYASQEDFEARRPIQRDSVPEPEDPPNPLYDPEMAQRCLCDVFGAYEASRYESRMKAQYQKQMATGDGDLPDPDDALSTRHMIRRGGLPPKMGKWFMFPEMRELNGALVKGLWEEAKAMCEEEGWVLVDEDGGLVYKAGLGEKKL